MKKEEKKDIFEKITFGPSTRLSLFIRAPKFTAISRVFLGLRPALGAELKRNIKNEFWKNMTQEHENIGHGCRHNNESGRFGRHRAIFGFFRTAAECKNATIVFAPTEKNPPAGGCPDWRGRKLNRTEVSQSDGRDLSQLNRGREAQDIISA